MEFKNTKPTAADFFRKYSDLVKEAEESEGDKKVDKDIKKLAKDQKKDVKDYKAEKDAESKKDKKHLKEAMSKWDKMMGVTPQQLQEKYEGFAAVEKKVAKNPKVRDPGAVAASIGRKKYGKAAFQKKAAAGKKEEGCMDESQINEKWDKPAKLNPAKKGMFKGKTKADVSSELSKLKKSGPHKKGSAAYTKEKELAFAKRAKGGWKKGKSSEEE